MRKRQSSLPWFTNTVGPQGIVSWILPVGCGTGLHLSYLKHRFQVEGLDLDEQLLAIARQRNPEVPLHHADMIDFDLGRTFDIVTCLFSAIGYVKTLANLSRAIQCIAQHLTA